MRIRSAIIPILVISTCGISCERAFLDEPATDPVALFVELWSTFEEQYAPFEERGVDWGEQYRTFRPLVSPSTSEDELFDIMGRMLAVLNDGHVSLTAPGREIFFSNYIRREQIEDELFNLEVIRENYLEPGYESDEMPSYLYGKIRNHDIGYIFFDHVGENLYQMNRFLEAYGDMDGFIMDFRHNQGGDFTYCYSVMGRLTDRERYVFKSKTKNGPGVDDYTDWMEWYITPEGSYIGKTIVVLADRYTISAGERSVMAFMILPNVTLLGDTTSGAHGTMIGRELANGWFFSLVPQKVVLFAGNSYEGICLIPDLYFKNEPDEVASGIDSTLLTAVSLISPGLDRK
ncbi:MAG: hypothetical protein EHM46_00190 [Bacteroidetes bacterium]|nr:MAG: hypothetical protein EHM46_00190 [Bacteroidota bacterium]